MEETGEEHAAPQNEGDPICTLLEPRRRHRGPRGAPLVLAQSCAWPRSRREMQACSFCVKLAMRADRELGMEMDAMQTPTPAYTHAWE